MATIENSADDLTPAMVAQTIDAAENLNAGAADLTATDDAPAQRGVQYATLCQRHPSYNAKYWRKMNALYAGGKALFEDDPAMLRELFPRHRGEVDGVYNERLARCFYVPYPGEIIDHIVAALFREPVTMRLRDKPASPAKKSDGGDDENASADPVAQRVPDWYKYFARNVSPGDGPVVELNCLLKRQIVEALKCKTAWTLIDLPKMTDENGDAAVYGDRGSQERAGALNAYACKLEPESVVDWKVDAAGKLEWAIVWTCENERADLISTRDTITQTWTYYTRHYWARFRLVHKIGDDVKPDAFVPLIEEGVIEGGRVPILMTTLTDGMWAMSKLEGLAREHFNKRSAQAWAEFQSLLPELYEFLGSEEGGAATVPSEAQTDPSRATSQARGQGYVQERGADDKAMYIGPDSSPFTHVMASCNNVRDEMHRVTHRMSLSTDNSAAALGRSGDSKQQDKAADSVVLVDLGVTARSLAEAIFEQVSLMRGEPELSGQWQAQGMERFDAVAASDATKEALDVDVLNLESPTFRRVHRLSLMKLVLGDQATDEVMERIRNELAINIPDEMPQVPAMDHLMPPTEAQLADHATKPTTPEDQTGTVKATPVNGAPSSKGAAGV